MSKSEAGRRKNNPQGNSKDNSDKDYNNWIAKNSRASQLYPKTGIKYLLYPIKFGIKFLHPKYIPENDPRREFYTRKLEEYTYKRTKLLTFFKLI